MTNFEILRIICSLLLLLLSTNPSLKAITAFNLDTTNYIVAEGNANTMFGFSVALHQEDQRSWVIVGAPRDSTGNQAGVDRGGAVYRCEITDDNRCQQIPFDLTGNNVNADGYVVDQKSNQWFGATVSSAGIDGPLVACAPRYVFYSMQPHKVDRREPVGTCFLAKNNFKEYTEYSPCRTMYWGYHKQGSCQAGLSAALTKDGSRLFIGAPGSWYWQGQVYSINTDVTYPFKPPRYGEFGDGGQSYSFDLRNPKNKVWSTRESTASEDDSYLGYSSVTGDFNGDGNVGVAVGMPRGGGLLGKIVIFSWNMTNQQNITGEQIGAYFGYSMCVVDVDGDKLDDLIIGAPMYTEPNNKGNYEMGRVYIIFQGKYNKFQELTTRDGANSRARFGLALTSLGDVNLDGYGDFAVGAPYDGRGAVYIFHGSKTGPLEKPSQVIRAEDVPGIAYLSTFGFSLSGGIDLDGNMYPDLAVGAYEANKAITFKSRPVAVFEASTTFETESKLVSLDDKKCSIGRDKRLVTCTTVSSCLKYNGINLPGVIDVDVSWILDSKKPKRPRMFFIEEEGKNIRNTSMRLQRGIPECRTNRVYIEDDIRDKLTPLEVEMNYNLREAHHTRRVRSVLEPVIDQNRGTVQRDSINIQKNCGPDNVCIPDLRLSINSNDSFILGSKNLIVFDVAITNYGEDAFESGFFMTVPPGLNFRKIEKLGPTHETPITCAAPTPSNPVLKCDVGNPLPRNAHSKFQVILSPSAKPQIAAKYDFNFETNSTNPELQGTDFDNIVRRSLTLTLETDLSVRGVAIDEEILYNVTDYKSFANATMEKDLGPQVVHIYEIRNGGPSAIEEVEIYFIWPRQTVSGDELLYLLNQPETSSNLKCDLSPFVNEKQIQRDTNLERTSYLAIRGAVDRASLSQSAAVDHQPIPGQAHGGGVHLTDEEKRKILQQEEELSKGDASLDHIARANAQNAARTGSGSSVTYSGIHNQSSAQGFGSGNLNHQNAGSQQQQQQQQGSNFRAYQQQGQGNVHSAGFGGGSSSSGRGGVRKLEDFPTEENVNQDISGLQARTQATGTGKRRMMSQQDGEAPRPDLITGVTVSDKVGGSNQGFQAGFVELDPLNRNNVDDDFRRQGNSGSLGGQSETSYYQSGGSTSSGGQTGGNRQFSSTSSNYEGGSGGQQGSSYGYQQQSSTGTGLDGNFARAGVTRNFNENTPEGEYYDDNDKQHHQQTTGSQQYQHYRGQGQGITNPGTTVPVNQQFKFYSRYRRDAPDDSELRNKLKCDNARCVYIRCTAGPLERGAEAFAAFRMRLIAETVPELAPNTPLNLSTKAVSRITRLPHIGIPAERPLKEAEIKITAIPVPEPKPDVIPLWIVVLSAVVGVIILLLLIYLLYKCGFFKRNRPDTSQERQPLNRNGAYHGDEHL